MGSTEWSTFIFLVVLVAFSAFFSSCETAFLSVNKIRLKGMADEGNKKAKKALIIAEKYDKTLSVILVGNNIVNIAATASATAVATNAFGPSGIAISTAVMTVVILIFGEVLPKSMAKANAEEAALLFCKPLGFIITILTPIAWFFVKLQQLVAKLYAIKAQPSVTEQELLSIIETVEEEGVIDNQRSELMQSVLAFNVTTVSDVITHRVDVTAISLNDTHEKILNTLLSERFSRIPVYGKNLDDIIGILHTRDYLDAVLLGNIPTDLLTLVAKPIYIHKTKRVLSLLNELKIKHIHMAVVLDDYGGTLGIVTMEDLLEEIVGDIYDEDEEIETDFFEIEPHVYSISGDHNILEALELIGYFERDFDSDYSTVGGWAIEMLERVPELNDSFEYKGIQGVVIEVSDQRVHRVRLSFNPQPTPPISTDNWQPFKSGI